MTVHIGELPMSNTTGSNMNGLRNGRKVNCCVIW